MAFKKVEVKQSFPKMEEEILKFWEENEIFQKSVEKNPEDKSFVFYEGPPTANGVPGLHHVLARAFKDIIPRYKTMKGYRVERKAGWDTHGLPVELQVEKALGLKNKQEIENIVPGNPRESIIEFNKKCKESVWLYRDLWEKLTRRMAYWVDMKNPYVTYENKYIESVWWVIAQIFKTKNKNGESLIYQGHKVVPYCYRCGTALSSHEVAQGYQVVKDNSVYVKFKLKPNAEKNIDDRTYFLAWTTTPWTLPGNVALAVNKDINYVFLKRTRDWMKGKHKSGEDVKSEYKIEPGTYIVAEDIFWKNMQGNAGFQEACFLVDGYSGENQKDLFLDINEFIKKYNIKTIKGKDLLNLEYESLYNVENKENKKMHYIVDGSKFVTTQEGTGIVHIAPAFGEDDSNIGRENDLPTLITVDTEGKMSADVPGKGIPVKKKNEKNKYSVDELILEDLKKRELLFKEELYEHDYPFCWRCDTPLIYYAKPSWFIRMSEFSEKLVKNNEKINWIPEHFKEGRFGEWLRGVKDWAISRERYWGTPLPIWKCEKCGELKVIESQKELEDLSGQKIEDLHKPYIDEVKFKCVCGEEMQKVPEVLDVWFDSGSMPLAQFYYPNSASIEEKEKVESGKFFPADYICEAVDQTRGWFYTLHAIATLLNESGKVPTGNAFKNVICLGHILDAKGKKMSKSKGNVIEPMKVMDEYGADMLRWMLYTINQPGLPKKFDIKNMKDIMNRVFRMLWNSYSFFVMYANIDKLEIKNEKLKIEKINNLLDRWIISEMQTLIKNVDEKLEAYDVYSSAKSIEVFVDNLSNWYIRRSRKRFWKSENDGDKNEAYATLHYVLVELSKLMAPFTPFISEEIYRNLTSNTSPPASPAGGQPSPYKGEGEITPSPLQGEGARRADEVNSVHLADFPIADEKLIDEKLNKNMQDLREIITLGLQDRAKNKIKVRQPLSKILLNNEKYGQVFDEMINKTEWSSILYDELNVKGASLSDKTENVMVDTEITPELKLEGQAREVIRFIQEMRKEAGYEVDNRIEIVYSGKSVVLEKFNDLIAKETLANGILSSNEISADLKRTFEVDGEKLEIGIKKQ